MSELDIEIEGLLEAQEKMEQLVRALRGDEFLGAMRDATLLVTRDAKKLAPVDTGRLRSSITPEVRPRFPTVEGVVGSAVEYAPFQEFGTRNMPAQPYLNPALAQNAEAIVSLLGDFIGKVANK